MTWLTWIRGLRSVTGRPRGSASHEAGGAGELGRWRTAPGNSFAKAGSQAAGLDYHEFMHTSTPSQDSPQRARWWHLAPKHLLVAVFWSVFFLWLNRLPLESGELWGDASYGKWILANQAVPAEDPLMPLAAGMRLFDSAWLSQVIFAWAHSLGGAEALSFLFAASVLAAQLILARAFYLQTRSLLAAHVGVLLVVAVSHSRLPEAQPDIFGMLCLAVLLWLLVRDRVAEVDASASDAGSRRGRWTLWLGIPLLLAMWANLHGSFVWGLLVLVCWAAGVVAETVWRQRGLRGVAADAAVRRWVWLSELALVASCLNPYGVQLVLYHAWFADFRQLQDLEAWQPLVLLKPGGRELVASLLVAIFVFRLSRRKVAVAEALLLVAFSFVFAGGVRMAWWYAAVFGVAVTPHLADLGTRWARLIPGLRLATQDAQGRPRFRWAAGKTLGCTVMTLGVLWICFALSPAWSALVRGQPRSPERLYGYGTPWKLSGYLREQPPEGQVFHPHWWGDWLIWDGPPRLRPFLTSNLHLVPPKVWTEYRIIRETRAGWDKVMLRYGVRTAVLDRYRQKTLQRYLRQSDDWQVLYEDEWGLVFGRTEGKPSARRKSEETEQGVQFDE